MSQAQPFLIANTRVGLERDLEPFLLPVDAYPDMQDCYEFRGRIRRRRGYQLLGRLNRQIGTIGGGGGFGPFTLMTLPTVPPPPWITPAASSFQVGTVTPRILQDPDPNPANNTVSLLAATGSGNLTRNSAVLNLAGFMPGDPVFYYPGLPVMGLATLDNPSFTGENNEGLVAFDTRFAYLTVNGANPFQDLSFYRPNGIAFNWTGTDSQFFWTTNYAGALWATNDVPGLQTTPLATIPGQGDGIRWLDQDKSGWVNFVPQVDGTNFLMGALIIIPYKDRLICLNTQEGTNVNAPLQFSQRARWCQNGTPFYAPSAPGNVTIPTNYNNKTPDINAWRSDIVGKGGFIDAPTLEQIISADFVYDSLIVYFERSTWQLRYTGNELLPFVWEKINTELGAQSTFSIIPLDHRAIAFGNVGLHSCDSVNVDRIDQRIPDEVFSIQNANQGPQRVYGIRDYFNQLLYWTLPYIGPNSEQDFETDGQTIVYPNKTLVYNYIDKTYSFYNDSFTCFGYYQAQSGLTWSSNLKWGDSDFPWVNPEDQSIFQNVVGGNQQGYVEIIAQQSINDESLFISNITPGAVTTIISPNHNLQAGDFIKIITATGITGLTNKIFKVQTVTDANTLTIATPSPIPTGVFTSPGSMTQLNNYSLLTKRFNLALNEAAQTRLLYADFYMDRDDQGQVQINLFINESEVTPVNQTPLSPISTVSSGITAITAANPAVVTVADGTQFSTGDVVFITAVLGMVEIDNLGVTVASVMGNNVTLGLDSSAFTAYTGAGTMWNLSKNTGNYLNLFPETTYATSQDTAFVNQKLWKRIYFNSINQLFQLQITLNDNQMLAEPMAAADITLHGLILWTAKAGRLINV